ncbi:Polyneuridine-aldehyde esterase [Sesamum alatum]|uniref:Polyneuridine-aldehyde esterase n=1 Tax=Sesamum alatum TaxID=300844 RepID=A0AAE1YSW6_9LAMI|nr:Polyneuridine-aldehyde esterase [Sesamum alatum]
MVPCNCPGHGCCRGYPKRVEELRSFSDYCQPLLEFLMDLPQGEKVVLVGHSMGGACISLAMEKFRQKIAVAVFTTAFMPGPCSPLATVMEEAIFWSWTISSESLMEVGS